MSASFRIEEITTESFKGQTGTVKVGPLTLLTGPNGSGKSAIEMAARFATTGQTDLGKRPDDNIALCGPRGGAAGLKLSSGFQFSRRLVRDNAERTLSTKIAIAGRDGLGLKEAEVIVRETVGDFAPMWSVNAFLGLSIDKQRAFILDLSAKASPGGGVLNPDDLLARAVLEMLCADPDVGEAIVNSESFREFQVGIDGLAEGLRPQLAQKIARAQWGETKYAAVLEALNGVRSSIKGDVAEAIAGAISRGGELAQSSKRDEDEARASIRALSDRQQEFNDVAGDLAGMQTLLKNHESEEHEVIQKIGQAEGREGSEASTRARIESIDRDVLTAQTGVREIEALPAVPDDHGFDAEIDAACAKLAASVDRLPESKRIEQELQGACDKARATLATAQGGASLIEQTKAGIDSLKHQIGNAEQAIIGLESVVGAESPADLEAKAKALQDANPKPEDSTARLRDAQQAAGHDELAASAAKRKIEQDLFELRTDAKTATDNPWAMLKSRRKTIDAYGMMWPEEIAKCWAEIGAIIDNRSANLVEADVIAERIAAKELALKVANTAFNESMKAREAADKSIQEAGRDYQGKWTSFQKAQSESQALFARAAKIKNESEIRAASLKSARERRDRLEADLKAKTEELGKLGGLDGDIKALKTASTNASVAMQRHRGEMDSIREEIAGHEKKIAELRKSLESNAAERARRNDHIAQHNLRIARLQDERAQAVKALETLTESRKGDDLAALRGRRVNIETAIAEVKAKIEKKTRFDLLKQEFDAANLKAENQRIFHDCCKALVKALKVIRETIMRERVEPVVSRMDRFLEAAMPGTRAFCDLINDLDRDDFALGWKRGDLKVTLPALSGGERAIFQAALLYALVTLANPPLRLLLIEAAEIDNANLMALVTGCEAIKDEMSNVLIATYNAEAIMAMPGWTIINKSERKRVPDFGATKAGADHVAPVEMAGAR